MLSSAPDGAAVLPAKPEPLTLNPAETAVIVVDLQNAYASKNGYLDKAGFDVSTTAQSLKTPLKCLKQRGLQACLWFSKWMGCRLQRRPAALVRRTGISLMPLKPCANNQSLWEVCGMGTWDYALVDALKPQDGDIIIPKPVTAVFIILI